MPWLRLRAVDLSLMGGYELPKHGLLGLGHRSQLGVPVAIAEEVLPVSGEFDALKRMWWRRSEVVMKLSFSKISCWHDLVAPIV